MVLRQRMDSMTTPSSLTSNELNMLVFRYLSESGFAHSAFTLGYEAGINKTNIDGSLIPPGALVNIVQKGLQYIELEANLERGDKDGDYDFSFLQPLDLITKEVNELQRLIEAKKENLQKERDSEKEWGIKKWQRSRTKRKIRKGKDQGGDKGKGTHEDKSKGKSDEMEVCGGSEPMDITPSALSGASEINSSEVTILEGHESEVFSCAWSPIDPLLASGSHDSTAWIWTIPHGPCGSNALTPRGQVLEHFKGRPREENQDLTTVDWNGEGTLLATGCLDGQARIWSKDGELKVTLAKHKGSILSLKWNKKGNFLLSGSADRTAIVWDTSTWECTQQFEFHSAAIIDVDWRNNAYFATCSTDCMIYICKIGEAHPIKAFAGHEAEVNAVKWNPTGSLLASCSDDGTAKIWSLKQDKCLLDFRNHLKEVYTITWSPTGLCTSNPFRRLILASGSVDSRISLWEVEHGILLCSMNGHSKAVYSVAFSPDGRFLASGSLDHSLHIWSVKEGMIIKTYNGGGAVYQVCWNKEGDKLAACFADGRVCVMDFRM